MFAFATFSVAIRCENVKISKITCCNYYVFSFITCNYFLWSSQAPPVYLFDLNGSRDFEDHELCQYLSSDIPSFQHSLGMYISYLEIAVKSFPRLFFTSGLMDSCSCVLKNSEKVIMKIIFF